MKRIAMISTAVCLLGAGAGFAQSNNGTTVQVKSGHFCAWNKCVRFSADLREASVSDRLPFSVEQYGLHTNPTISEDEYRQLFRRALVQPGVNGSRS